MTNGELPVERSPQNLETALKALLAAVPTFGGPIASIISDMQAMRKEQRLLEFINGLREDLSELSERINSDFISKDDFLDIFEDTAKKIFTTRQTEKRRAFRNILSNSMISTNIAYNTVEEYLSLLDTMRDEHILMLRVLYDPIKYDAETGNRVGKGGGGLTSILQIMSKLFPDWGEESIKDVASKLEGVRLVQNITGRFGKTMTDSGINHLINCLTPKGIKFVNFINTPE